MSELNLLKILYDQNLLLSQAVFVGETIVTTAILSGSGELAVTVLNNTSAKVVDMKRITWDGSINGSSEPKITVDDNDDLYISLRKMDGLYYKKLKLVGGDRHLAWERVS